MDWTEQRAYDFLLGEGYTDIIPEPDGNVPPDLLINGGIAVEVRRLNQHDARGQRGLEETSIPFEQRVENLLITSQSQSPGIKWITVKFRRPIPKWKKLKPPLVSFLHEIDLKSSNIGHMLVTGDQCMFKYVHLSESVMGKYALLSACDLDSGGLLVSLMIRNIQLVVDEKTKKIAQYRDKYPKWWLVLLDHIGLGLSKQNRTELLNVLRIKSKWDRIVLVNPLDLKISFNLISPL